MNKGTFFNVVTVFIAMFSGACTIPDTPAPPLVGPSELALSLVLSATPDILPENGASQSVINIFARDTNGQPVRNLTMRVDTIVTDPATFREIIVTDRGTLSANTITTDSNGRASVIFTAPMSPLPGVDDPFARSPVNIRVMPVGADFNMTTPRFVSIRLVPNPPVIVPGAPIATFTAPASAKVGTVVQFNASASSDPDGFIVSYQWNWGDGTTGQGAIEDHDWSAPARYFVTLTVRDNSGKESTAGAAIDITP